MKISSKKLYLLLLAIFITGIIISFAFCSTQGCRGIFGQIAIATYDECVESGFPVVASDPPRCIVDEETVFIRAPKFIRLSSPKPGDPLTETLTISGKAKALDNTVHYRIQSGERIISKGMVTTDSPEHGRWGDFSQTETLNTEEVDQVDLFVFSLTPDNEEIDTVRVSLSASGENETNDDSTSSGSTSPAVQNKKDKLLGFGSFPPAVRLDVPFTPQAPFADWSKPFDEACEEASLLMAIRHTQSNDLSLQEASNEIIEIVNWQKERSYAVDVSIEELADIARAYYDAQILTFTKEEVSIDSIKKLIAAGHPVVVPAAGQMLGNPYFRGAGPPYHMLVITGYDDTKFFTNDPGTKRGEGFAYDQQVLFDAIHDWNGSKETIESGQKAMLIISSI